MIFLLKDKRIHTMDEIRGLCIICMVLFHGFFTAGYVFNIKFGESLYNFFLELQPLFASFFIVISGISTQLSRNNLKRGLQLLAVAIGLSIISIIFLKPAVIYFGILHLLSISILLFIPLEKAINKTPTNIGLIASVILFLVTIGIEKEGLGIPGLLFYKLPEKLFTNNFFLIFGFRKPSLIMADYFPLLPWFFPFLFGTFLGKYAKEGKFPSFLYVSRFKALSYIGQHTLLIYIIHQPIIFAILYAYNFIANLL